ncbi:ejaculatory bulb-specific protein 3-like isoform X2 [Epargyreus clarus]
MKSIVVLFALVAFAAAETYSTKNDHLDVEKIVSNTETLQSFLDCFNDKKDCSDVQADFKKDLPEVYEQACDKCTDAQKHLLRRFQEASKEKLPDGYTEFKKKYDPEGKYSALLEKVIANA